MKAGFFYISLAVAMFACKSANNLEKKEAELANYKKQYEELETKIASLEKEISLAGGKKKVVTKPVYVSIDTLEPGIFRHYVEVQGKVDTDKNITLVSKASGTIEKIYVQKGQYVKAGTLLASIDDAIVQKGIEEVNTQLAFATNVYEKQKRLWDQKIGSEIQYLSAKNNKESLEKRKESLIEQHQLTKIKSPIDGVVDEIFPNQGEVTAPGAPAFRVINSSAFKILAEIPESYVSKIRKGDEAILTFPDVEETAKTKVTVVSDVVNAINRSFQVELDAKGVKNLKANLIANVKIKDYEKTDVIIIPINVIQHSDQGDYVFIADKGVAVKKMITTGKTYRSSAEVLSGLNKGDKLITVGYQDIVDGQPVTF
ncbi:hypothetical protein MYP_3667 [Sporocytophaga myxococcoides]|uniref:Uncharacterized protein n=1 Tax=Sporocytophaga myxococcoides TaxID=153721 RepID=A0A098LJV2_9BACT|nr:efflux RND transporter periplasmic adaptor subunit [Sporocytophaga myxococcoides]GAL86438.1 hypothetical protein MYP_3667 [Sporocytophaga myxococcoides]